jgi:mannitol 2-dehydrogenase
LDLLALALAAWLRRVRGEDESGQPIEVRHPLAEQLRAKAVEGGSDPRALLGMAQLFGDTGTDARLVGPVGRWLASLYANGSHETLASASRLLGF